MNQTVLTVKASLLIFYPESVPPVPKDERTTQRFGLRVFIYEKNMDEVLKEFNEAIKKGELSSETVTVKWLSGNQDCRFVPRTRKEQSNPWNGLLLQIKQQNVNDSNRCRYLQ